MATLWFMVFFGVIDVYFFIVFIDIFLFVREIENWRLGRDTEFRDLIPVPLYL